MFLSISCCKDKPVEPQLPALTHKGNNTFGCYINGEPFIAKVDFTIAGPIAVSGSFNEETKLLKIQGTREDDNDNLDNVRFDVYVYDNTNHYDMTAETDHKVGYLDIGGTNCDYYHDTLNRGNVEITFLDEENNIISGRFEMDLINPDCSSSTTMHITEGRFDFGY